ncbi:MAG: inorganic diphosphatase [Methanobacterium sp.]|nr:inorganic diphosphatase [Methanobacterium sp.]
MNLWKDLKTGPAEPQVLYAVIEIPKGSRNKYEYDKDMEAFALDRVLYSPIHYPAEYGIIPQTLWDDGDPMDIIVLMEQPTFPGCVIEVRPVGIMRMIDSGDSDDKILSVPINDPQYNDVNDLEDLSESILNEIKDFFASYKKLEGKKTQILGWENKKAAIKAINHSIGQYRRTYL